MHRKSGRSLVITVVTLLSLAFTVPAFAATSLNISVTATTNDFGDALLMGAAALFFGLDTTLTMQYRTNTGSSLSAVSLFYVAGESQVSPESIIIERKKGRGWGALAKGKVPPGLAKKWKGGADPYSYNDRDFETGINIHFLSTYYAVPEDTLVIWVRRGISVPDLAVCLNLATRARVTPSTIVDLRLQGRDWPTIATKYKVSVDLLKQPVQPKAKYGKPVQVKPAKPAPPSKAPAKGNDNKGKGKGK